MGIAAHLDQVFDDVKPENVSKFDSQAVDEDLPGLGQHYCVHCRYLLLLLLLLLLPLFHLLLWIDLSFFPPAFCSRYFIGKAALDTHFLSKTHKKRLKLLKEEPYTLEEAEAAAGLMREKKVSRKLEIATPAAPAE